MKCLERNTVANLSVNVLRGMGCIIYKYSIGFGVFLFASVLFLRNACLSNLETEEKCRCLWGCFGFGVCFGFVCLFFSRVSNSN